jgi:phosphoribosyl-ATP pyrophosphohydrolase/phosphoribosyl-AMP cyclohydrolase
VDVTFNADGLVPAIVQDDRSGAVLMLGWMNREAFDKTRTTGQVHFYSRSRKALWRKGETSGHTLSLRELRVDCDQDAVLVLARPEGPTCHTGKTSCFFTPEGAAADDGPAGSVFHQTEQQLLQRLKGPADEKSYSQSLWRAGMAAIVEKIREEQQELSEALEHKGEPEVIHEAADLLFHVLVALRARNISLVRIEEELSRRLGKSGIEEKASR